MPDTQQHTILPLAHAPFLACLIDEGIELEHAHQQDQNGPDLEGHLLETLNSDVSPHQKASIDWSTFEFQFAELEDSDADGPEEAWTTLAEGHPCRLMQHRDRNIRDGSRGAWLELTNILLSLISRRECFVLARTSSAFNLTYEPIAYDVWQHFTVTDWLRGNAETPHGERLYAVMIAFGDVDEAANRLNASPDSLSMTDTPTNLVQAQMQEPVEVVPALEITEIEPLRLLNDRLIELMNTTEKRPIVRRGIAYFFENLPNITMHRALDKNMLHSARIFTGVEKFSRPSLYAARDTYVKLRELANQVKDCNFTVNDNEMLAFYRNQI